MSLFDRINVAGNKLGIEYNESEYYYQTQGLGNNLFTYKINSDNQLIHDNSRDSHVTNGLLKPLEPLRYVGKLEIYISFRDSDGKLKTRTYTLTFEDFKIIKVECGGEIVLDYLLNKVEN